MKTVRLTMAQALVRYLIAQRTVIDGQEVPLFAGVFAIFGHGNVTCLGEALEAVQDVLPTWRGQNEQSMALAAIGFAKAKRRRQIMVAPPRSGPGATNMVTAAGVAHANRLPVLLLAGDDFANRASRSGAAAGRAFRRSDAPRVNDAFKAGDPLLGPDHPAGADHLVAAPGGRDDARSRPIAARPSSPSARTRRREAYDYPVRVLRAARASHPAARGPTASSSRAAATLLRKAKKPLIIAGGGVHYSRRRGGARRLRRQAQRSRSPRRSPAGPCSSTSIR